MRDRDARHRQLAVSRLARVEAVVAGMDGLSDAEVVHYFQMMLDDAEPGTKEIVQRFIEAIKAARAS
jgi:hypothetical protein